MKKVLNTIVSLREHGRVSDSEIAALLRGEAKIVTSKGTGLALNGSTLDLGGSVVSFNAVDIKGIEIVSDEPEIVESQEEPPASSGLGSLKW